MKDFITHDSGGVREPKDYKLHMMDYDDPLVAYRFYLFMKEAEKTHGRGNWKYGFGAKNNFDEHILNSLDALIRHVEAVKLKILYNIDGESELARKIEKIYTPHLDLKEDAECGVLFNIICLMLAQEKKKLDIKN